MISTAPYWLMVIMAITPGQEPRFGVSWAYHTELECAADKSNQLKWAWKDWWQSEVRVDCIQGWYEHD